MQYMAHTSAAPSREYIIGKVSTDKSHVQNLGPILSFASERVGKYVINVRKNTQLQHTRTIILIHGIGVSSKYFIPLARELAKSYNVIALDLPGYGGTPKPAKPLTVKQLARVVLSYLKKHNISDTVLVGHSMGCQIIAHINAMDQTLAHKMILISPTVNRKERNVFKQGVRLFQNAFSETLTVNAVIFSDYLRMGPLRYLRTSRWMVEDRLDKTLADNITPTLIVRGEKDPIVPHDWVSYLKNGNSQHALAEIPKAPHALHYTYAKQTATICTDFIKK